MRAFGCLVNGVPRDVVAVSDRGLQYGDGLFETIAVRAGAPCLWSRHIDRLQRGCRVLNLSLPPVDQLLEECLSLTQDHDAAVLKIILTRGSGGRGYTPPTDPTPVRILSLHPSPDYPPAWRDAGVVVTLCRSRSSENNQLAGLKHLNRLDQVLARKEVSAADGCIEGLMRDSRGRIIGGTMTNLFLWADDEL
ncbi:MAG: aminodeoxychorismate lyase, partial [Cycloclasticus sp.]|nr:aminodeoxychorismate lyase [Cycloclasticus sp.]